MKHTHECLTCLSNGYAGLWECAYDWCKRKASKYCKRHEDTRR